MAHHLLLKNPTHQKSVSLADKNGDKEHIFGQVKLVESHLSHNQLNKQIRQKYNPLTVDYLDYLVDLFRVAAK